MSGESKVRWCDKKRSLFWYAEQIWVWGRERERERESCCEDKWYWIWEVFHI